MEPLDIMTVEGDVVFMVKECKPDPYGRHICPCGNPPRMVSLGFEAAFCSFPCLSQMWREFDDKCR